MNAVETIDWTELKTEVEKRKGTKLYSTADMFHYLYWRQGMSLSEIGAFLGVSGRTVSLKMQTFGIKIRPKGGNNAKFKPLLPKEHSCKAEKEALLRWKIEEKRSDLDIAKLLKRLYGVRVNQQIVARRLRMARRDEEYVLRDRVV